MSLRNFITGDWLRKIAALIFAVLIYYHVNDSMKRVERISSVPVKINLSQDLIMTTPQTFTVSVQVRSMPGESAVDPHMVSAVADVSSADRQKDGTYLVSLKRESFRTSPGIEIVSWSPRKFPITLQRRIYRDVPVVPRFSGRPHENYRLSESVCIPKSVTVSGTENVVSALKVVSTAPIPLDDCEREFEYESELDLPQGVSSNPERIKVQIGIENIALRQFQRLPVGVFSDVDAGISASFVGGESAVTLTLRGTERALADFTAQDVRLYVDIYNVSSPGEYTRPVNCHIRRPGIEVDSIVPAELKVSIIKAKAPIKKP